MSGKQRFFNTEETPNKVWSNSGDEEDFSTAMKVSLKSKSRAIAIVTSQLMGLLMLLHLVAKKMMLKVVWKAVTVELTMVVMEEIV